jgi:hypothetical protein
MRDAIAAAAFDSFRASTQANWKRGDIAPR